MDDGNINILSENKMLLDKKYYELYNLAATFDEKYMNICFSGYLNQVIAEPKRTTERTKTLIDIQ